MAKFMLDKYKILDGFWVEALLTQRVMSIVMHATNRVYLHKI